MLHPWNLSPKEATALQRRLASLVVLRPLAGDLHLVAGADAAYPAKDKVVAAVAVYSLPGMELRQLAQVEDRVRFPYVPGLLSFREIPSLLKAFALLRERPQVVLCDGQGIAHERRLGLASHLGLWLGLPTVGCAKTRLVGEHRQVGAQRGQYRTLVHRGERVGVVLRTRTGVNPVYVSPGHLADIASSRRLVLGCSRGFRIPEPIRAAHLAVQRAAPRLRSPRLCAGQAGGRGKTRGHGDTGRRQTTENRGQSLSRRCSEELPPSFKLRTDKMACQGASEVRGRQRERRERVIRRFTVSRVLGKGSSNDLNDLNVPNALNGLNDPGGPSFRGFR